MTAILINYASKSATDLVQLALLGHDGDASGEPLQQKRCYSWSTTMLSPLVGLNNISSACNSGDHSSCHGCDCQCHAGSPGWSAATLAQLLRIANV